MSFTSRFKQRKTLILLSALVAAPLLCTLNSQQTSLQHLAAETKLGGEAGGLFESETKKSTPPTLTWREIQATRTAKVVRVRFQIKETATSVDEQLMQIAPSKWDAIVLSPQQERETKSNRRFEVAIVGKARIKIARLGLSSDYFKDKWIEVTGVCRHDIDPWAHGDVSVSQFLVNDLDMIEVNDSNWEGNAFD
ncbi:hypothetical protein Pan241w_37800 [Gimesia alba]|uniref:Uncharacterized protein n=1 Tax=Gimesia alba TaxID=2527973 RepID=A0A517RIH7_9PLAN|nr:hypothetical protein [Gimesia alba]QDT43678.1 hypothetical protein Pan241w_37800 [Gimesia alba]